MDYTPTTELEAVNLMLETIGEQPVTSILVSGVSEATIAATALHRTSRAVQSIGLNCNSEENYPLLRDVNGFILIPANTLKVDGYYDYEDIVQRRYGNNMYLYDKAKHTFVFTEDKYVNITFFLPFADLPEVVRNYIMIKAARGFQQRLIGSDTLDGFTAQDEQEARLKFIREEVASLDANIKDDMNVYTIVSRRV